MMTVSQFNKWVDGKKMTTTQIAQCARIFLKRR